MKAKLTIFFYVALLPSIIYGGNVVKEHVAPRKIDAFVENVEKIARVGGRIEGIFQPEGDGPLGIGAYGFTFRGTLFPSEAKIAMKFTLSEQSSISKKEYEIYTYLNAINRPEVEQYGIPSVYYFGKWNEHSLIMMGMSLLDRDVETLQISGQLFENDVNVLIILRDFILTSKYMHSRGVRHDDVKIANIMVRGHRSFLIDFNISSKMNERNDMGSPKTVSRGAHWSGQRYPKDDWESFLYSICIAIGVELPWRQLKKPYDLYKSKSNTNATLDVIKQQITSKTLSKILVEWAEHVFDNGNVEGPFYDASNSKKVPDYNHFYGLVNDEIVKSKLPPPAMFTWLTPEETKQAVKEFNNHEISDITKISEPKDCDFLSMKYSDVDFNKFSPDFHEATNPSTSHQTKG